MSWKEDQARQLLSFGLERGRVDAAAVGFHCDCEYRVLASHIPEDMAPFHLTGDMVILLHTLSLRVGQDKPLLAC